MAFRVVAGLLGLSLTAGVSPVAAQGIPGNLYVGGVAGIQVFSDNEDGNVDIDFDTGYVVGALVGFRFSDIRAEAELDYQETEANAVVDVEVLRYTAGIYYDITFFQLPLTPYVGGGFGLASIDSSGDGNDATNFTLHGEFGVSFDLAPEIALVPGYRYEWIDESGLQSDDPITSHAFRLGFRYSF